MGVPSDTCMGVVTRMVKITITATMLTFTMVILFKDKHLPVVGGFLAHFVFIELENVT